MLFTVRHPQLLKLNQRVFAFNCLFHSFYSGRVASTLLNHAVFDRIVGDNLDLLNALRKGPDTAYTPFERLVHAHLRSNLEAQRAYLEYWFLAEIPTIEELIGRIFGPEAVVWLEHAVETYDFSQEARLAVIESRVSAAMIESGLSLVRERIEEVLPILKEELVDFVIELGLLPATIRASAAVRELRISLKPAPDAGASYYTDSGLVEIGDEEFHAYLVRNRLVINPGRAVLSLAHECIGHAIQGLWSSPMPEALAGHDMNLWNLTSMPTVEGLGVLKESIGEQFLRARRGRLGFEVLDGSLNRIRLRDDEVEYAVLANEVERLQHLLKTYGQYLALKQRDDPETDLSELFAERWGRHLARSRYRIREKVPSHELVRPEDTYDFLYNLSYVVGPRFIERMQRQLREKHAKAWGSLNEMERDALLSAGAWAIDVYPEWLAFAARHWGAFRDDYVRAALAATIPEAAAGPPPGDAGRAESPRGEPGRRGAQSA